MQLEVRQSRLCLDDGEFPMAEKRPAASSSTLDTGREAKRARLESREVHKIKTQRDGRKT